MATFAEIIQTQYLAQMTRQKEDPPKDPNPTPLTIPTFLDQAYVPELPPKLGGGPAGGYVVDNFPAAGSRGGKSTGGSQPSNKPPPKFDRKPAGNSRQSTKSENSPIKKPETSPGKVSQGSRTPIFKGHDQRLDIPEWLNKESAALAAVRELDSRITRDRVSLGDYHSNNLAYLAGSLKRGDLGPLGEVILRDGDSITKEASRWIGDRLTAQRLLNQDRDIKVDGYMQDANDVLSAAWVELNDLVKDFNGKIRELGSFPRRTSIERVGRVQQVLDLVTQSSDRRKRVVSRAHDELVQISTKITNVFPRDPVKAERELRERLGLPVAEPGVVGPGGKTPAGPRQSLPGSRLVVGPVSVGQRPEIPMEVLSAQDSARAPVSGDGPNWPFIALVAGGGGLAVWLATRGGGDRPVGQIAKVDGGRPPKQDHGGKSGSHHSNGGRRPNVGVQPGKHASVVAGPVLASLRKLQEQQEQTRRKQLTAIAAAKEAVQANARRVEGLG